MGDALSRHIESGWRGELVGATKVGAEPTRSVADRQSARKRGFERMRVVSFVCPTFRTRGANVFLFLSRPFVFFPVPVLSSATTERSGLAVHDRCVRTSIVRVQAVGDPHRGYQ